MAVERKKPKKTKCRNKLCGKLFWQYDSLVTWCSSACGYEIAMLKLAQKKAKEKREYAKETRRRRAVMNNNDRRWLMTRCHFYFHEYIQLRDAPEPCIDCGLFAVAGWQAGHFKTQGAYPELRFHWANVAKQCSQCNKHGLHGTARYRMNLVKKIGEDMVRFLEGPHQAQKLTIEDMRDIIQWFKDQTKQLKLERKCTYLPA